MDNILAKAYERWALTKFRIDSYLDKLHPIMLLTTEPVKQEVLRLANSGVKSRTITEITEDNISYVKELIKMAGDNGAFRHLDNVTGNFSISDGNIYQSQIMGDLSHPSTKRNSTNNIKSNSINQNTQDEQGISSSSSSSSGEKKSRSEGATRIVAEPQSITSTIKAFVDQQQYIFEMMWDKAIPADQKIKEIEEGIEPIKTEVLEDEQEILKKIIELAKRSHEMSICSTTGGMQLIYNNFFEVYKDVTKKYKNGKHKGIRWIVSIKNKNEAKLVTLFLSEGIKVRHVNNVPLPSFALSDKMLNSTIEKMEDGKMVTSLLSSNDVLYLNHYNAIFKELWKTGIDAKSHIKDIEDGRFINVDIILNPKESLKFVSELNMSAKKEILIILSSENGFYRTQKFGGFNLLNETASRGIKVKILIPSGFNYEAKMDQIKLNYPCIEFRNMEFSLQMAIGITVVDREKSMIFEIKDDSKNNFLDALGLAIHIEGKSAALSYLSIFNSLWDQTEMYQQLKDTHDQLLIHERMQKEFIETAAHELRTPIQPILGITEFLNNSIKDNKQKELLTVISRNAQRLKKLSEDILDITRIESKSLNLE
ncbi:MAG: hypothetical protein H0X03_07585, partial [Nitrosopumilus sp.]|nr:hypothetical protein [Nitrosopumilus sp.]